LLPFYRSKEIKILAMGSQQRAKDAPDVPTFRELGYPDDFILTVWSVIVGPPDMPAPVADKLNGIFSAILDEQKLRERFAQLAVDPGAGSRNELADMLARETATWTRVAQDNNIEKE
jgi:tripartite-type tricarboxylate transporter receptor subunit TctC